MTRHSRFTIIARRSWPRYLPQPECHGGKLPSLDVCFSARDDEDALLYILAAAAVAKMAEDDEVIHTGVRYYLSSLIADSARKFSATVIIAALPRELPIFIYDYFSACDSRYIPAR